MLYWTNFIMKSYDDEKPWLCSTYDGCLTLDAAMRRIEDQRKNYIVLSAWIDILENEERKTIFHECYLDAMGNVRNPTIVIKKEKNNDLHKYGNL